MIWRWRAPAQTGALFTSVARDPRRGWVDLALLALSTVGPSRGPFFADLTRCVRGSLAGAGKVNSRTSRAIPGHLAKWFGWTAWRGLAMRIGV